MRLLILDNEFPPLGGGTGVINYHVMRELDRNGQVEVDLITSSRTRDQFETESFGEHSRIFKVPVDNQNIHHSTNLELLRYTIRGARQAMRLMRQRRYHLCWAYATVPAGIIARYLHSRTGLPYILITQGPDIPWYEKRYYSIYPFLIPVIKLIWQKAAIVTAQSISSQELIARTSPRLPVRIIHNGVNMDRFYPPPEIRNRRGRRGTMTFLCSGRLIERKGQHYLLQAAKILHDRGFGGKFKIVLVGTGDNEPPLRAQCTLLALQDTVVFTGFVPQDAMPQYYAEADVFVLPSFNEGMSVALLEAMASGLPVVVTETGGTAELVNDNGFIVPWADPLALANALERFLTNPSLCQEMGSESHEVAKGFTWQTTSQEYLDLSYKYQLDSTDGSR